MANVLTDLAADIYTAADRVGRELTGASSSVTINSNGSDRAAVGDTVRSHFTTQPTASAAISEAMTIPEGTDQTVSNKTASISKAQSVQIPWTGENVQSVNNGSGFDTIYGDQIQQAMRTLANEVEADLMTEIYKNASRAVGTAGTTPFASNFDLVAEARQILVDNGCGINDVTMVLNTLAGTNLRNLASLQSANTAGGDALLRQGVLLDLQGIALKESAQVQAHTAGTATLFDANGGEPIGETTIVVDGSDAGTILQGDIVTFVGDSNKYVVQSATASGAAAGNIVIAAPGLQETLATTVEGVLGASYTGNAVFHRSAVELIMRAPAVPGGGDAADDSMIVVDPFSGLVFEIRSYKGYRKSMIEVGLAYGFKAWKPENIALVLG